MSADWWMPKSGSIDCDFCEEKPALWIVDKDLGDIAGEACVVYRFACEACKGESSYMEPEKLKDRRNGERRTEKYGRRYGGSMVTQEQERRRRELGGMVGRRTIGNNRRKES